MKKFALILIFSSICVQSWSMQKDQFEQTIQSIFDLYKNELEMKFEEISMNINWEGKTANASVSRKAKRLNIFFDGEFVRKYNLDSDSFALTVCHEIGHVLAGEPKIYPTKKYSSEAQSDYFATAECLPRYFKLNEQIEIKKHSDIVKSLCNNDYCLRALSAIEKGIKVYGQEGSLRKKSSSQAEFTILNDYPKTQCRIDTLVAGVMNAPRPACWFNKNYDQSTWNYIPDYEYEEALIVATAGEITKTHFGCHIEIKNIESYSPSYIAPLHEGLIYKWGVHTVDDCRHKKGQIISGPVSEYKGKLYLNLNSKDK